MTCKDINGELQTHQELYSVIKDAIRSSIDEEFTNYKNKCLDELDKKLELKRNELVCAVLNSVDISSAYQFEQPAIVIRVNK